MQHCDILILPEWCVPVEPAGEVLSGVAVAVSDGRIAGVLPVAEARGTYQPSVTIERPGHVLDVERLEVGNVQVLRIREHIGLEHPHVEVEVHEGDQPLYPYLVGVE